MTAGSQSFRKGRDLVNFPQGTSAPRMIKPTLSGIRANHDGQLPENRNGADIRLRLKSSAARV